MMQLPLSIEELRDLMEMTSLALTVSSTDEDESDFRIDAWHQLTQKIFRLAENEPSLKKHLSSPEVGGALAFSPKYIEKSYFMDKINDFSEHIFWSDLIVRMADKALEEHIGSAEFNSLSEEERRGMTEALEKTLWQECSAHGIDRLGFVLPPSDA